MTQKGDLYTSMFSTLVS